MADRDKTHSSDDPGLRTENEGKQKADISKLENVVHDKMEKDVTANSGVNTGQSNDSNGSDGNETLQDSCQKMFGKISEYLETSLEDYELLEKLNKLTKKKYEEMDNVTKALIDRMQEINKKYVDLQPYLTMIDKVDASVASLEQAAYKLDAYSKELETRFKKLEKAS